METLYDKWKTAEPPPLDAADAKIFELEILEERLKKKISGDDLIGRIFREWLEITEEIENLKLQKMCGNGLPGVDPGE